MAVARLLHFAALALGLAPRPAAGALLRVESRPAAAQRNSSLGAGRRHDWRASEFTLSGSSAGFKSFIQRYPCTRSAAGSGFLKKFDWVVHRVPEFRHVNASKNPYSVFAASEPNTTLMLLKRLEKLPERGDRVAYFTGDLMLSKLDWKIGKGTTDRLRRAFGGGIYWQAYDVRKPGFHVAPDGLNGMYLLPVWDAAERAIQAAGLDRTAKPKNVLAAWGMFHPNLDAIIPARRKLHAWVGTPSANAAGVEHHSFEPRDYWLELAKYRFTLSPRGGGIQSPKNDEALLVLTVPISTRQGPDRGGPKKEAAFDDLKALGWPMVVLNEWSEITGPKLDEWWAELSPRLVSFRKNCLTSDAFYRIVTGELKHCS